VGPQLGFDGVELRTRDDGNHFSPDSSVEEAAAVGRGFRDAGLPIMCVMGYSAFAHTDAVKVRENGELLTKLVELAEAMQAPFVRTFAGRLPEGASLDEMIETFAEGVRPIASRAADKGVRIGLETHDDWCSGETVTRVVQAVDSPGFGIVYDVMNSLLDSGEPWQATYAHVRDHLLYCHIKDAYRDREGKVRYVMTGGGDLPLFDLLGTLKRDGFDGFLSFEWEKKWYTELEEPERVFPQYVHKVLATWDAV